MSMTIFHPVPLSAAAFAPFGEVIEVPSAEDSSNQRFDDLAGVDAGEGGAPMVSLLRLGQTIGFPLTLTKLERHPLGSQAFLPFGPVRFLVVVAPGDDRPDLDQLRVFVTNGSQGVNYRRGLWHAPMSPLTPGVLTVIDRKGPGENCEFFPLEDVIIEAPSESGL
jgi:ureidoglycolate lyase